MLLMERELRLPVDIMFGTPVPRPREATRGEVHLNHALDLRKKLECVHDFARRHLQLSSGQAETRYNRKASNHHLEPGYLVWLYRPTRTKSRSPKLQRNWDGL
ncbi:unnamed protein product [Ixodes hexagonus]